MNILKIEDRENGRLNIRIGKKQNLSIEQAISELNKNYEDKTVELLIQGLAIDNESEITLEKIGGFIQQVVNTNQLQAKWRDRILNIYRANPI